MKYRIVSYKKNMFIIQKKIFFGCWKTIKELVPTFIGSEEIDRVFIRYNDAVSFIEKQCDFFFKKFLITKKYYFL